QIADLKTGVTGAAVSTGDGQIDTTGWTADEIMNYEMHGVIPARASGGSTAKPASTMVGGC
ncbi:MAG TPA: hypothetical protein VJ110_01750, partial [Candidatus Nanoarchaeia archaeon]|nr:hypothetical protein [Candidatus Nanoarchaeia archaeon]